MSFFDKLEFYSSNTAVVDEDFKTYSYKNLLILADEVGKRVGRRKIIFLICENSYEFLLSYVGLVRARAVIFLINNSIHRKKLEHLVKHYKPKYVLTPIQKHQLKIKFKEIFNLNNKYKLFETNFKNDQPIYNELALLMSTSGSTGSPKFVKLSYSNLLDNAKKIAEYLKIQSKDRPITTMQPSYSYGLSIINSHLIKGASIIMTERSLLEKKFWDIFKKKKATTFGGVPFIFEILKKLKFGNMELPYLKYVTQAGGKINQNLLNEFIEISKKKKIKFYVMYGQTEASPSMSILKWKLIERKIGSIGKPLPGGKFFIYDNKNKLIKKKNSIGELVYTGKNIMLGYAENIKDLQKGNSSNKKLFTGDLAKRDKDGFYYITGRKSRYIKILGSRLSLDEIEQQVKTMGFECVCMGKEDSLQVFITNSNKKKFSENYFSKNFSINKTNLSINIVSKIPKNQDGKILYSKLKNIVIKGHA